MGVCIKEFVIVNNSGNIFTGDNLRDTSFVATKTFTGSTGPTCMDVVVVIGNTAEVCLKPGDTITTTITRGSTLVNAATSSGMAGTLPGAQNNSEMTNASPGAQNCNGMTNVSQTTQNSSGMTCASQGTTNCNGMTSILPGAQNSSGMTSALLGAQNSSGMTGALQPTPNVTRIDCAVVEEKQ